jgi:hypothetical protein
MKTYFTATFLYMLAAILLTLLLHGAAMETLIVPLGVASAYAKLIGGSAVLFLPVVLFMMWWFRRRSSIEHVSSLVLVAVAAIWLQVGFLFFKSALPQLVPFYADPFWANLDRALLFGHDAWQLAHAVTPAALAAWFPFVYLTIWSVLAYAFPVVVAATDPDSKRVMRYAWLFFLSWVVVGNLAALAGSSVGPVYYDELLGTDRFASMHLALASNGFSAGPIAMVQERLWENSGGLLSFISAFPSVHVAVACIAALYIRERFRPFRLIGDVFLTLILLISVYSGYHYLLDGIASIMIVMALNAALGRHANRLFAVAEASTFGRGSEPRLKGEA